MIELVLYMGSEGGVSEEEDPKRTVVLGTYRSEGRDIEGYASARSRATDHGASVASSTREIITDGLEMIVPHVGSGATLCEGLVRVPKSGTVGRVLAQKPPLSVEEDGRDG